MHGDGSKIALLKRWIGIVTGTTIVAIDQGKGKIYSLDKVEGYYNDLTGKVSGKALLDNKGIPVNKVMNGKIVYFPIAIFQYTLGIWDKYLLTREDTYKQLFSKLSDWILNSQHKDGSWDCFSPIGHTKYSVSSMGQGEAISVLVRCYKLTNESKYLNAARKAIYFMIKEVKDGGTLIIEGNDYIFEEYPNIEEHRISVLNGWIFSLFGVFDFLKTEDNTYIKSIFEKSVDTLVRNLHFYDTGYWTYYDRIGRIASPAYHDLHIALLQVMEEITQRKEFEEFALKWSSYRSKKMNRMYAIIKKAAQKIKEKSDAVVVQ